MIKLPAGFMDAIGRGLKALAIEETRLQEAEAKTGDPQLLLSLRDVRGLRGRLEGIAREDWEDGLGDWYTPQDLAVLEELAMRHAPSPYRDSPNRETEQPAEAFAAFRSALVWYEEACNAPGRHERTLRLDVLEEYMTICQLAPDAGVPQWATARVPFFISRTENELSVTCPTAVVPQDVTRNDGWRALKIRGKFEFSATGILVAIAQPLAAAGIGILTYATYETDYVLVRDDRLDDAIAALRIAGHWIWDGVTEHRS